MRKTEVPGLTGYETTKKTMTLNLPEPEMQLLEELCKAKDMSKTAVMRQALKLYQVFDVRMKRGERMKWVDSDGNSTDLEIIGCGGSD